MMTSVDLSSRRKAILGLVVREYVATAQPVGSKKVANQYRLSVSPATVRNDMAVLEEMGLLSQPHTSAGRVPTETGYRYFVEHLLDAGELPVAEQRMIQHQFYQVQRELEQWVRLSAAVLAHTAHSPALATPPKAVRSRFKHLELIGIHDTTVLLVLVLRDGAIKQQMLTLDQPITQEELSPLSNELNSLLADGEALQITERAQNLDASGDASLQALGRQVAVLVEEIMLRADGHATEQIYRNGLSHALEQPEFADGSNARQIVQVFEQRLLLSTILEEVRTSNDVRVIIAGEGRWNALSGISLVLSRYGVEDTNGVLGVIGPLRMRYGRTISAVRFVAALMNDLMRDLYNAPMGESEN